MSSTRTWGKERRVAPESAGTAGRGVVDEVRRMERA
jgi:hypothetical protein